MKLGGRKWLFLQKADQEKQGEPCCIYVLGDEMLHMELLMVDVYKKQVFPARE